MDEWRIYSFIFNNDRKSSLRDLTEDKSFYCHTIYEFRIKLAGLDKWLDERFLFRGDVGPFVIADNK
jgi:hypothetical protein